MKKWHYPTLHYCQIPFFFLKLNWYTPIISQASIHQGRYPIKQRNNTFLPHKSAVISENCQKYDLIDYFIKLLSQHG